MMNQDYPTAGTRFEMHDSEFEIRFVYGENISYSSVAGGKICHLPAHSFKKLLEDGNAKITFDSSPTINQDNAYEIARRKRYIDPIIGAMKGRLLQSRAQAMINNLAEELKERAPAFHTVKKWITSFKRYGNQGLVPKSNGNRHFRFAIDTESILNKAIGNAYSKALPLVATEIHAEVANTLIEFAKAQGLKEIKVPSLRTVQRRIIALDPYARLRAEVGKQKAQRFLRAAGQKIISPHALSIVQIDTHMLDVLVVDPNSRDVIGRPYLVAITCIHTRMIVGFYVSLFPPSATTTLQAMIRMIVNHGVPAVVVPDRGIEFMNTAMFYLCKMLCVTLEISSVKEPNHKPHIESFFRTITHALIQRLAGTTFSNVVDRGDYNSAAKATFTLDQVTSYVQDWIENVYHVTIHSQTKRAPIQLWKEATAGSPPLKLTTEEAESFSRAPAHRTIRKGRIEIHNLSYFSHALTQFNGKEVTVLLNEMNLEYLLVRNPERPNELIKAISTDPEYTTGLTLNQHELARAELAELSQADQRSLGRYAHLTGLHRLMERIRNDSLPQRKRKKVLNGGVAANINVSKKPSITSAEDGECLEHTVKSQLKGTQEKLKRESSRKTKDLGPQVYRESPNISQDFDDDDDDAFEIVAIGG